MSGLQTTAFIFSILSWVSHFLFFIYVGVTDPASEVAAGKHRVLERLRAFKARQQRKGEAPTGPAAAARVVASSGGGAAPASPEVDDATLCVVCMDAPKTHLLLPCGHKCLCAGCAPDYAEGEDGDGWQRVGSRPTCPMCRQPARMVTRVWE